MSYYSTTQRYLPHDINTRFYACKLYASGKYSVSFVTRRYKISKSSLMRWMRRFDGTKESLMDKSHRPHKKHPAAHTDEEIKWIKDYMRRNPDMTVPELYGKLKVNKGYDRHPGTLYRVLVALGYIRKDKKKKKKKHDKKYDTPEKLGEKWQMDVKVVPKDCYVGEMPDKFYQYTCIDEASRQRFIYPYMEQSSYSSEDFLKRCIRFFGYMPKILQTDNGSEFCHIVKTDRVHPLDQLCNILGIEHKRLRPRTPWHNGKVERSHRNDQERFYDHMNFYSYSDLINQMAAYRKRSNNIPMAVLGWISPNQKRKELELAPGI